MRVIFLFFLFTFFLFSSNTEFPPDSKYLEDPNCCSSYGDYSYDGAGEVETVTNGDGDPKPYRYQSLIDDNDNGDIETNYCAALGHMVEQTNSSYDDIYDDVNDIRYYWHETMDFKHHYYNCECSLDDIPFPDRDLTQWELYATAINADSLPNECQSAPYEIDEGRIDCNASAKCFVPKLQKYDCTQKGEDWETDPLSDSTLDDCLDSVDYISYDQASWETGDSFLDTCCLHKGYLDTDQDTIPDATEIVNGTDPKNPDTDGDGKRDDVEGTADSDGDGAIDAIESVKKDTDGDGINDEEDYNPIYAITGTNANVNTSTSGSTTTRISNMADGSVITAVSTTNSDGTTTTTSTITNPDGTITTQVQTVNPDGTSTTEISTTNDDGTTTTQTTSANPDGTTTTTGTTTNPDGNVTVNYNYDSSSTDAILREIKVDTGDANNILQGIRSDITNGSDRNHEDLKNIQDSIDNIGKSIADSLFQEVDTQSIESMYNLNNTYETVHNSILNTFNSMVGEFTGFAPAFTSSGNCSFSFTVFGSTIELDLSIASKLRPYLEIIYTLFLAWVNFRIYFYIFKSFVEKA